MHSVRSVRFEIIKIIIIMNHNKKIQSRLPAGSLDSSFFFIISDLKIMPQRKIGTVSNNNFKSVIITRKYSLDYLLAV